MSKQDLPQPHETPPFDSAGHLRMGNGGTDDDWYVRHSGGEIAGSGLTFDEALGLFQALSSLADTERD